MKKLLVAYFSASGTTEAAAQRIAAIGNADLFAIQPEVAYTKADLDWMDATSRSSVEMKNPASRPAIVGHVEHLAQYDTVLLGFPIWWYTAPTIIKTFLEAHDFSGKKIALFATSGGSGFGKTANDLKPCVDRSAQWISERLLNRASDQEIKTWIQNLERNENHG